MSDTNDYTPIDCELYSLYELSIMHRQRLRVAWRDSEQLSHLEVLLPVDLKTEAHAEYLMARTRGGRLLRLRLDHIMRAEALPRH